MLLSCATLPDSRLVLASGKETDSELDSDDEEFQRR